jgi:hypothetical protein
MTRRDAIAAITQLAVLRVGRAQQQTPAFRADVRLITVDVLALERSTGRPLELLGPNDLIVIEDSKRREIAFFEIETTPMDVVFVPYMAGQLSTARDYNAFIRGWRAAFAAFRNQDRTGLVRSFREADNVALTEDRDRVRDAIRQPSGRMRPPVGYGERLYDALYLAVTRFSPAASGRRRRAVIAITDDAEKGSKVRIEDLKHAFLTADCTLNMVVLATAIPHRRTVGIGGPWPIPGRQRDIGGGIPEGASCREAMAATGGLFIPGDEMETALPDMIRKTSLRYLLGFYADPGAELGFHTLTVRLSDEARQRYPSAEIKHRSGYYTEPSASAPQ